MINLEMMELLMQCVRLLVINWYPIKSFLDRESLG
nr:MAG TPA: hypothetical protein [Caudoviricetes sp.]